MRLSCRLDTERSTTTTPSRTTPCLQVSPSHLCSAVLQRICPVKLPGSCSSLAGKSHSCLWGGIFRRACAIADATFDAGNVVSLVLGGLICYVWSMIAPEDYDFVSMKQIKLIEDEDAGGHHGFASVSHCLFLSLLPPQARTALRLHFSCREIFERWKELDCFC